MYVYTIAARHLRTRSIAWVAVAIVAAIVVLYLLVISVEEGFKDHYMDKLQSIMAHLSIDVGGTAAGIDKPEEWAAEIAKTDPGIRGVTIGLEAPAMAQFDSARTVGTLRGVDLDRELKYGRVKEMLKPEGITEFGVHEQGGKKLPGCIVGGYWRRAYNLSVGGRVTFLFSDEDENPRSVACAIIGFFESKNPYLEQGAYIDRKFLAEKIGVAGKAKTLAVWLSEPNRSDLDELRDKLREKMKTLVADPHLAKVVEVETWHEKDNKFYQALTQENKILRFIMAIFLALVAFVIYLIFGRLAAEKVRDIGALRAIGATPAGIRGCFLVQGLLIGLLGLAVGLILSYFVISNVNWAAHHLGMDLFPTESFGVEGIPHTTLPFDVILISVLTLCASLLGAFIPAWSASRLNPVECLRHE